MTRTSQNRAPQSWCAWALWLPMLVFSLPTWAQTLHHEAQIQGMVCAFCAYNAAQELKAIPDVDPVSVRVDPSEHRAVFEASRALEESVVADALESAGFHLVALKRTESMPRMPRNRTDVWVKLEFQASQLEAVATLLSALGDTAARTGGELRVTGPAESEKRVAKSLTMGKQAPVHLTYSVEPGGAVHIALVR